jgi:hypothetical protein
VNYKELVGHFGGPTKAAQVLGLELKQTVHAWGQQGRRIPSKWQLKAEALSRGKLKADRQAHQDAAELAGYVNGRR